MRLSLAGLGATIMVGLFVAVACSSAESPITVVTPTPPASPAISATTAALTPVLTPLPTPVSTPIPTPSAPPTVNPTRSADAAIRVVELTAILVVANADRFETFGRTSIRLERVWSPNDTGLGGTCGPTNVPWLECLNVADWLIQPVAEGAGCPFTLTASCYDGPRLKILYEPELGARLGLGDGPVDLIGHFGDPASEGCRPENRAACRDRFVVTAIEQAGP